MTTESDSQEVVRFALVPVGRAPHRGNTWQFRPFLANARLQAQVLAMPVSIEFVDHAPSGILAVKVHTTQIHEIVKTKLTLEEQAYLSNFLRVRHFNGDLPAKLDRWRNQPTELVAQAIRQFKGGS